MTEGKAASPSAELPPSALELLAESEGVTLREYARSLPPALVMLLDPRTNAELKLTAHDMAKAEGMIPKHLLGKPAACFAVLTRSITWRLDPYAVAMATYETPGGRVGFEGKLVQAILERSGKFDGPIRYVHFGDWEKLTAKGWAQKTGNSGKPFPAPNWSMADAKACGCGVTVHGKVKGEVDVREWSVKLEQCFPMNSTLWALDPRTQICYLAVRRFANLAAPSLLMGAPFDEDAAASMVDVTPAEDRPQASDHVARRAPRRPRAEAPTTDAVIVGEGGTGGNAQGATEPVQEPEAEGVVGTGGGGEDEASASEAGGMVASEDDARQEDPADDVQADDPEPDAKADDPEDFQVWHDMANGWREALALCKNLDEVTAREKEWKSWRASPAAATAPEAYLNAISTAIVERKHALTPRRR